jgi:CrcB protein
MEVMSILAGGALGGMARFWIAERVSRGVHGAGPPAGILLVNASGALLAGLAAAMLAPGAGSPAWDLAVVGFLGSYTTVSSFSLQTLAMLHDGKPGRATANIAASLALTLGGVSLGWLIGRWAAGWPA